MGCPHDCVFCSQKKITGVTQNVTGGAARKIIDDYLQAVRPSGSVEISFFGGSFTGIPKAEREELLSVGYEYVNRGLADGIRLSTRPDYINIEILDELMSYGVTAVELGVQSMDDEVLDKSGRGHTSADVVRAVDMIKKYPFELGLQMMTGLPGDTPEKSVKTAEKIAKLSPDAVRVYPTLVIRGTELERMMKSGVYVPWTVEETVPVLVKIKRIFDNENIKIIRMGLQTTDEISPGASVVGGPFHPAIGELTESEIFYEKLLEISSGLKNCTLVVACRREDMSKVIGHNAVNRKRLEDSQNIKLKIQISETAACGELIVIEVKNDCF